MLQARRCLQEGGEFRWLEALLLPLGLDAAEMGSPETLGCCQKKVSTNLLFNRGQHDRDRRHPPTELVLRDSGKIIIARSIEGGIQDYAGEDSLNLEAEDRIVEVSHKRGGHAS